MRLVCILGVLFSIPILCQAQTIWYVPDDYSTIQGAISNASVVNGDTVIVRPGTYVENIDYLGKAITLRSMAGAHGTVIDGGNPSNPDAGSVVTFQNGEGLNSILDGFTITNGTGTERSGKVFGGGIYAYQSSPMVMNNIITMNSADWHGGGVSLVESAHGRLTQNTIVDNVSGYQGGGISIDEGGTVIIANCLVGYNEASADGGGCWMIDSAAVIANCQILYNYNIYWDGAGLWCWNSPNGLVTNCNILYNNCDPDGWGGGIYADYNPPPITNCIVRDNEPTEIWGVSSTTYSNVGANLPGAGCINAPPQFVDSNGPDNNPYTWEDNDFHIKYTSPCRDAGNSVPGVPGIDWEGDPRKAYGTVDMGADEFYPHLYYVGNATPSGNLEIKFIGLPGDWINGLILGVNLFDPPLPCDYGLWYMDNPFQIMTGFGTIPSDGVKVFPGTIPASPPAPYTVYLQGVIDMWLTNLCTVNVE